METIARIPHLAQARPAEPAPPSDPAAPHPGLCPGTDRRQPPFPTWSVACLAVVAVIAWTFATWHEQERLARQRRPARIALQPPATTVESIAP